jgi:hypothetical protein
VLRTSKDKRTIKISSNADIRSWYETTYCESHGKLLSGGNAEGSILILEVLINECFERLRTEIKQLLALVVLLLLSQTVLRLGHFELPVSLKSHETNS